VWLKWDPLVIPGPLDGTPVLGRVHQGPACCAGCAVLPTLGGPWRVHLSTHRECVGGRVHQAATYISGDADHVGLTYKWSAADVWLPWEPVSSGGGRCRVRLLGGGLLALVVFLLLDFILM
jgi:hypothetical protein